MIDNQGKRLTAVRNHVPDVVILMLFGVAGVACGFSGYASGLDRNSHLHHVVANLCRHTLDT
jgi:hypothetical protein